MKSHGFYKNIDFEQIKKFIPEFMLKGKFMVIEGITLARLNKYSCASRLRSKHTRRPNARSQAAKQPSDSISEVVEKICRKVPRKSKFDREESPKSESIHQEEAVEVEPELEEKDEETKVV